MESNIDEKQAINFAKIAPRKSFFNAQKVTFIVVALLAIATRFYSISTGNFVLWDEAHFGKFGSHYLKNEFYFDVHPPLGKMIVGLAGYLSGYDGSFDFGSGKAYPDTVNYVGMRMILAMFGVLAVPFAYMTAVEMRLSRSASLIVAAFMLFENGLIGISRLILLDSTLLFFTVFTTYFLAAFYNRTPFTRSWWLNLIGTGFGIGCVSSVKWVGFFTTALVGLMTIRDLWNMYGDVKTPIRTFTRQFSARALALIFLPISIYMLSFKLHFMILWRSGPGDAQMSSLFQAGLAGNDLHKSPLEIAFGSKITLKSCVNSGGLLHSHIQTYPEGSLQQQVTTYHHKDQNNMWTIIPIFGDDLDYENEIVFVKHMDKVRLLHDSTGKVLHSHNVKAPVSTSEFEVSGYGNKNMEDPNDEWTVEIVEDLVNSNPEKVQSLTTRIRLRHNVLKCLLASDNSNLPEWGFKQGEVYCTKDNESTGKKVLWNVETHINPKLPEGSRELYRSKFMDDFVTLNIAMFNTNNALTPDPELEPGILTSSPLDWPFMQKGIRMSSWADVAVKFYMLGNPFVWWGSTAALIATVVLVTAYVLRAQRGMYDRGVPEFFQQSQIALGGWMLHYLPFFLMGRVTYLHHYYPSLFFSILCFAVLFNHLTKNLSTFKQNVAAGILIAAALATFVYFAPICYGIEGPAKDFASRHWLKSWNLT